MWIAVPMKSKLKNGHRMHELYIFVEILVCISKKRSSFFIFSSIDNWQERQYPFTRDEWGVWRLTIPPLSDGSPAIKHGQIIKVKF
jgi:hypothetical protein